MAGNPSAWPIVASGRCPQAWPAPTARCRRRHGASDGRRATIPAPTSLPARPAPPAAAASSTSSAVAVAMPVLVAASLKAWPRRARSSSSSPIATVAGRHRASPGALSHQPRCQQGATADTERECQQRQGRGNRAAGRDVVHDDRQHRQHQGAGQPEPGGVQAGAPETGLSPKAAQQGERPADQAAWQGQVRQRRGQAGHGARGKPAEQGRHQHQGRDRQRGGHPGCRGSPSPGCRRGRRRESQ